MDFTKNFESGIENILKNINRHLKLSELSTALINRLLNRFLNKIANTLLEKGANKGNEISLNDIQNAMGKYFSKSMMRYATFQGTKILSLYRNGSIKYHPKAKPSTTSTRNKDSSAKDVTLVHYKKGMNGILKKINSELILNERSCKLLEKIFNLLITKITNGLVRKKIKEGNNIFPIDVQNELGGDLSEEVMKCAIAEGSRALLLYHNGLLKYRFKQSVGCVMNYKKGINEILRSINKDFKFKQNSWVFLATVLNTLTTKIFQSLSEENVNNGEIISLTRLRNVLKKRFSDKMLNNATREGTKVLSLHQSGLLKYQQKKSEPFTNENTVSDSFSSTVDSIIRNEYSDIDFETTVGKRILVFLKKSFHAILAALRGLGPVGGSISMLEVMRSMKNVLGENLTQRAESEEMKAVTKASCEFLIKSKEVPMEKSKEEVERPQILSKTPRKSCKKVGVKRRSKKKTVIRMKPRISSSTKKQLPKKVGVKRKKSKIKKSRVSCKKTRISSLTKKKKSTRLIAKQNIKLTVRTKSKRAKNRQFVKKGSSGLRKRSLKAKELKKPSSPKKALRKQLRGRKILGKFSKNKRKTSPKLSNKKRKLRKLPKTRTTSPKKKQKKLQKTKTKFLRNKKVSILPSKKISTKLPCKKISKKLPRKKTSKKSVSKKISKKLVSKKISKKLPSKRKISKKLSSVGKKSRKIERTPRKISGKRKILRKLPIGRKAPTKKSKQRKISIKPPNKRKISKKLSSKKKTLRKQPLKRKALESSIRIVKKTRVEMPLNTDTDSAEILFRPLLDFVAEAINISFEKSAFSEICHKLMIIARKIAIEAHKQASVSVPLSYSSINNTLKFIFSGSLLRHAETEGLKALHDVIRNVSR